MRKPLHWLNLFLCLSISSCGPPEPLNMRQEFAKGIEPLGVVPFYPLREDARLGQVYLVDATTVQPGGDSVSFVPTNTLVTNAAVPFMEQFRSGQMSSKNRFPCSSDKLGDQITLADHTRSYYQQADCAAASSSGQSDKPAGSQTQQTNQVTITIGSGATQTTKPSLGAAKTPDKKAPESLAPLELAGIPSYSLASIDNVTLAGSAPTAFANFLVAIGFSRSTSLVVQAEGVEVATLPSDDFAAAISKACFAPNNPFGSLALARPSLAFADQEMRANARTRQRQSHDPVFRYDPRLLMLRKIFYLRGIRYIFTDTRAYAAALEAAASSKIPVAQQPPTVPNISMNVVTTSQGTQAAKPDAATSQMSALQNQIDALRSAVSSNSNIQVAGTYARVTARGIEFVDLFQRPLAFGYVPIGATFAIERGFEDFCARARGELPTTSSRGE
jgi:hypothetical protein